MLLLLLRFPLPQISSCAPLRGGEGAPCERSSCASTYVHVYNNDDARAWNVCVCVRTKKARFLAGARVHVPGASTPAHCRLVSLARYSITHFARIQPARLHGARARPAIFSSPVSLPFLSGILAAFQELATHNFPTYADISPRNRAIGFQLVDLQPRRAETPLEKLANLPNPLSRGNESITMCNVRCN